MFDRTRNLSHLAENVFTKETIPSNIKPVVSPLFERTSQLSKAQWKNAMVYLKAIWITIVFVFLGWYLLKHPAEIKTAIAEVRFFDAVLAILFLYLGKLLVAFSAVQSFAVLGEKVRFAQIFYVYIVTDIAKYLPGGIWALASRLSLYGVLSKTIRYTWRAFFLESIWLLCSSFALGLLVVPKSALAIVSTSYLPQYSVALACFVAIATSTVTFWLAKRMTVALTLAVILTQIGITLFLGVSVWSLFGRGYSDLPIFIGAFALARVAGYLAFFAPAGIGVRELAFTLALSPLGLGPKVLILSGIYRLITASAEFVLFCATTAWEMKLKNKW